MLFYKIINYSYLTIIINTKLSLQLEHIRLFLSFNQDWSINIFLLAAAQVLLKMATEWLPKLSFSLFSETLCESEKSTFVECSHLQYSAFLSFLLTLLFLSNNLHRVASLFWIDNNNNDTQPDLSLHFSWEYNNCAHIRAGNVVLLCGLVVLVLVAIKNKTHSVPKGYLCQAQAPPTG